MQLFVRPKSLTELVTETIRGWIITGEVPLGGHLSEARIAKDLNVSRTPVREGINRLEMEGLVTVEPQRGTFVFNLEPKELAKLCDARLCLETVALTEAMEADRTRLHAELSACVAQMSEARERADDSAYLGLDSVFHQIFFDCSDNRFLNDAYQTISQKVAALRNRLGRHPDHMAKSYREHCEMTEAVGKGELDRALAILRKHIDRRDGSYWKIATEE